MNGTGRNVALAQVAEGSVFYKTKMCSFFAKGRCTKGASCTYSHDRNQQRAKPDLFRTQMCPDVVSSGECKRNKCRYAHYRSEVRLLSACDPHQPEMQEMQCTEKCDTVLEMDEPDKIMPQAHVGSSSPIGHTPVSSNARAGVNGPTLLKRRFGNASKMEATAAFQNGGSERSDGSVGLSSDGSVRLKFTGLSSDGSEMDTELVLLEKNTFLSLEPAEPSLCVRHLKSTPGRLAAKPEGLAC